MQAWCASDFLAGFRGLIRDREFDLEQDARFRDTYNCIRPHQALDDRTPRQAYLDT
jgi:putative transposase